MTLVNDGWTTHGVYDRSRPCCMRARNVSSRSHPLSTLPRHECDLGLGKYHQVARFIRFSFLGPSIASWKINHLELLLFLWWVALPSNRVAAGHHYQLPSLAVSENNYFSDTFVAMAIVDDTYKYCHNDIYHFDTDTTDSCFAGTMVSLSCCQISPSDGEECPRRHERRQQRQKKPNVPLISCKLHPLLHVCRCFSWYPCCGLSQFQLSKMAGSFALHPANGIVKSAHPCNRKIWAMILYENCQKPGGHSSMCPSYFEKESSSQDKDRQ